MPFHAHEVLEDAWKAAAEPERALWRGLAQLAVGLTHAARGNAAGAAALLRRGAENIGPYGDDAPHGIDVTGLARWANMLAKALETHLVDATVPCLRGTRRHPPRA
jgi:predicted metal-dependent hydrolase